MDKVNTTQQNKPINHVVKIKREIKNKLIRMLLSMCQIYELSLINF